MGKSERGIPSCAQNQRLKFIIFYRSPFTVYDLNDLNNFNDLNGLNDLSLFLTNT
jgi:hypothetical protein